MLINRKPVVEAGQVWRISGSHGDTPVTRDFLVTGIELVESQTRRACFYEEATAISEGQEVRIPILAFLFVGRRVCADAA